MHPRAFFTTGLLLLASLGGARAQTLLYPNFSATTGLTLNDAVVTSGSSLLLASNASDKRGSFFTSSTYTVTTGFSAVFQFRISSPGGTNDGTSAGADGLAFVVQRVGPTALGGSGEALGYGARGGTAAITASVAVEFDTFRNSWDPSSNHVGLDTGGNLTSVAAADITSAFDNGVPWMAWVDYDGARLQVRLSQDGLRPLMPVIDHPLDLLATLGGTSAYIGFTGATGSAYGNHEVLGFALSDTYLPDGLAAVPEPATWTLLGGGLLLAAWVAGRRRRA